MRRILSALLALLSLCACSTPKSAETLKESKKETVGVWITYSELDTIAASSEGFESAFNKAAEKCKDEGINTIFAHVRPFCDAVYPSEYFPKRKGFEQIDALKIMAEACGRQGIELHAWINPYRISHSSADISSLPDNHIARRLYSADEKAVCFTESGMYLNPASRAVRELILNGIREITEKYEIAGIHFDDYFYPTTAPEFDSASYEEYRLQNSGAVSLEEWRRQNVNSLIQGAYCAVKAKNKGLLFGVSPAADIEKCRSSMYADVSAWMNGGYIDYIMPQLYFGFKYPIEAFRFDNLLEKWLIEAQKHKTDIYIGLASYKVGTQNPPDNAEWEENEDNLARQIALIRKSEAGGFVFFSYSTLFGDGLNEKQLKNIQKELKRE